MTADIQENLTQQKMLKNYKGGRQMKFSIGKIAEQIGKARNQKGFTLIEMAIVLVIIGIIIGAIMKGRDVIRNAQIKEFEQNFVGKWITNLNGYYDKTGANFTDGAKHGGTVGNLVQDGFFDGVAGTLFLYNDDTTRTTGPGTFFTSLRRAGIDPCLTVKSNLYNATAGGAQCTDGKNVTQTKIDGEHLSRKTVTMGLYNTRVPAAGAAGAAYMRKNVLFFTGVPLDVAIALDKLHDGIEGGDGGTTINLGCAAATSSDAAEIPAALPDPVTLAAWTVAPATNNFQCTVGFVMEH